MVAHSTQTSAGTTKVLSVALGLALLWLFLVKATSRAEPRLEFSRLSARLGSKSAHLRAARLGSKFEKNRRLGSARIFEIQNGSARLGSAHFFAVCILDSNQVFLYMDTQTRIYTLYICTPRTSHAYLHTNIYV